MEPTLTPRQTDGIKTLVKLNRTRQTTAAKLAETGERAEALAAERAKLDTWADTLTTERYGIAERAKLTAKNDTHGHAQLAERRAKLAADRAEYVAERDAWTKAARELRTLRRALREVEASERAERAEVMAQLKDSGLTTEDIEVATLPREERATLNRLVKLHNKRTAALGEWRTAPTDFPALLELVVFRGVSTIDAGQRMGCSREAIARRIRPMKAQFGLTGRGLAVREKAEASGLKRPFAKLTEDALIERGIAEMAEAEEATIADKARADALLLEMVPLLKELEGTVHDTVIAHALGLTTMTVYRMKNEGEQLAEAGELVGAGS